MKPRPYALAYLGRILPAISETFVVREIVALRRLGLSVKVFSLHPPETGVSHPEAPNLARETEVLIQPRNPRFWLAHLIFALRFPRRYFHCLYAYVLTRRRALRVPPPLPVLLYGGPLYRLAPAGRRHSAPPRPFRQRRRPAWRSWPPPSPASRSASPPMPMTSSSTGCCCRPSWLRRLLWPASAGTTAVTCESHYPEARRAHLTVVRNGLDTGRFCPNPHPQGVPPCIIAVGRLVETKGFHVLVEACARLRDRGLPCQCLIIGAGPEAGRIGKLINDIGVIDRVVLKGKLSPDELLPYYRRADVLAMPACIRNQDADGIPTVLIEAMAMEIPVVATRVSGIPELVVDGETGLLVAPDDAPALAEALARLLQDQNLARRLAVAGRDLVVAQYRGETSARQLCRLFAAAIEAKRRS